MNTTQAVPGSKVDSQATVFSYHDPQMFDQALHQATGDQYDQTITSFMEHDVQQDRYVVHRLFSPEHAGR